MSKNFSQIVAELYARPVEGEDLYIRIRHVGEEMRKVVQSEGTMFGRFQGLLESFREIIPDEQQRYQAALKALSTTLKLSRQEIINAFNGQLEELRVLEKGLLPAQAGWHGELQAMEARSQMLKGEMANLRARIAQLESEEQSIQAGMDVRGKYLKLAEKTMKELFANIGAEITALNKKVEELPAEASVAQSQRAATAVQPAQQAVTVTSDASGKEKEGSEQKVEIKAEPVPEDAKFQRKCPQCGGQLNLLELENMWQCFTCGYEEPSTGAVPGTSEPVNEPRTAPAAGPVFDPSLFKARRATSTFPDVEGSPKGPTSSEDQQPTKKKDCPVCSKKMFWYPEEKAWRCPSCQYLRRI